MRKNAERYLLENDKGHKGIVQEFINPKDNLNSKQPQSDLTFRYDKGKLVQEVHHSYPKN